MELLWPDHDAVAARNNLHQVVHAARSVLGARQLTLDEGMLALGGDVDTDVEAFEAAAAAAHATGDPSAYGTALDAFGGELLPEDRYEPWTEARRASLNDLHGVLCLELAERQPAQDALQTLQRALTVDPLLEPAHRALMHVYDALGRRQDALAQYQRLRAGLRRSLEAEPAAETRALYSELLAAGHQSDGLAQQGLPPDVTSFVGRNGELAAIAEELAHARVLTLTGPGGSGKTRLAVAAAARAARPDGVVFVELAAITEPELVGDATATAVGIRVPARRTAAEALADELSAVRMLLVLDTCEHVVDACAALAETIVERCPEVTVLATSRERLRCSGERTWQVPGLTPDESLELFLARARDADPGFAPSEVEVPKIAELCARLEGMPLALELAAARIHTVSPAQITARLDQSLDILSAGRRTARSRQQTLRATISWSHDLLDGEECVLFRRLAVFAGSFSLDAATDVCGGGVIEMQAVVPLLLRLVEKSLAVVEDAELARYRLLDTVRQFAEECLAAAGEREAVEARLRDWALAYTADPPPLTRLELDHDNVRAALDSGLRADPQGALRLAATMSQFWLDRNYFTEGSRRLRAVLDAAPEATELRATTLLAAAALELRCGRPASFMALGNEAAALARRLRRPLLTADVVHRAGLLETAGGTLDRCAHACEEALALAGDHPIRASILSVSSLVSYYLGELDEARRRLESALDVLTAAPATTPPFFEGITFGFAILPEGRDGRLRPFHEETLLLFHGFDRAYAIPHAQCNLGLLARADGRRDDAESLLEEALTRFRRLGKPREEAHALAALGNSARSFGEPDVAVGWLEQAVELRRRSGDRRALGMTETAWALAIAFGGDLERADTMFARTHDTFRAADDAPGQGGALVMWGLAHERAGDAERAADLIAAGADVWERGLEGPVPGWGLIAASDALGAVGRDADARIFLTRAERVLRACGEKRGVALCQALSPRKEAAKTRPPSVDPTTR